jgi:tyrosine-protein kinase Etk/Wzc
MLEAGRDGTDKADVSLGEGEDSVDLIELLRPLYREKRTIFATAVVCFIVATIYAFLLPFQYTSDVSFIAPSGGSGGSMAAALAGQLTAVGAGDLLGSVKSPGDLYAGILRSRSVASTIVKQNDLMSLYKVKKESQAEKVLAANTVVTIDAKSTIVTLSVTDKDPVLAQKMANDYMDALRNTNGRLALSQSSQRRLFFEQQLAKEKDALEDAEVELKKTEEQSGLIAPNGQTESEIQTIAEMQAQMASRQIQLAALRQSDTDQNPQIVQLKSEIEDIQEQLSRLQKGSSGGPTAAIPTSKVPELQLEYVRKEREVKYHEALFEMLSKQYEAARLDESRDAPVLQVLDEASYPDTKSSPKRSYYMAGGLGFGLFLGSLWVLGRHQIRSFRSSLATKDPLMDRSR